MMERDGRLHVVWCLDPYQSAVEALLYLSTTTRPDIAYVVSKVARFNQNPGVQHWIAVKHHLNLFRHITIPGVNTRLGEDHCSVLLSFRAAREM